MSLTAKQEIPFKPVPKQPWSARALFPARALAKTLKGIFLSPYDILLGLLVFAIVVVEIAGRSPFMLYFLALATLAASFAERYFNGDQLYKKVGSSNEPSTVTGKGTAPEKVPKHE